MYELVKKFTPLNFPHWKESEMAAYSEEKLKAIIAERLNVKLEQVVPEAGFKEDLGADSLDLVEMVMGLEDGFEITIKDEDAEKIITVGDAMEYLKSNLPAA